MRAFLKLVSTTRKPAAYSSTVRFCDRSFRPYAASGHWWEEKIDPTQQDTSTMYFPIFGQRTTQEPSRKKAKTGMESSNSVVISASESGPQEATPEQGNALEMQLASQCEKTPVLSSNFGLTWFNALKGEFSKDYFKSLSDFVVKERATGTIYPPPQQVFAWTNSFPIRQTKVVILGQDPYHGPGQAHGLCFSVPLGVYPPPSLVNIFKEIRTDIPGTVLPSHGNLTGWAEQGVLLLNACLTVRAGAANSHKDRGWEQFTDAVVMWLNDNLTGVVFLLWGRYAQVKGSKINKRRHHVLTSGHPSPLSWAHFQGCKHFSKANEILKANGKDPVNWARL